MGVIKNFKWTEGINDKSMRASFRKWTGMPMTIRQTKIPSLALNQAKLVAEHRKRATLNSVDKVAYSLESSMSFAEEPTRNISQSAWNKIRIVEMRKRERLVEFNP